MTFTHMISITLVCKVIYFFQYNCLTLLHLSNGTQLHRVSRRHQHTPNSNKNIM